MEFKVRVRKIYSDTFDVTADSIQEALNVIRDADTMGEINPDLRKVDYELV